MKFRPLADRVLIKLDAAPEKTPGGLYIPKTARVKPSIRGLVVASGPGMLKKDGTIWPNSCEPGDHIILADEPGLMVTIDEVAYTIVRDDNILAVETFDEAATEAAAQ